MGNTVDTSIRVKVYRALPDNVKEFFETGKSYNNSIRLTGVTIKLPITFLIVTSLLMVFSRQMPIAIPNIQ